MPDVHAKLSASSSHRWLNCTPSIRLENECGIPDSDSSYAAEGTLAHSYCELMLKHKLQKIKTAYYNRELNKIKLNELYSPEMDEHVESYVAIVYDKYLEYKNKDDKTMLRIEERLDYSPWAKNGFGTGDCVIICDNCVEIIDFKYGKGVPVSAENNPQMMLYALGALNCYDFLYDEINNIKMTIVQPRINNTNSWELDSTALLYWAKNTVVPKADMADKGLGEAKCGAWCKFCKAKPVCKAYNDEQLQLARMDFREPELLSDDEIAEVLKKAEQIASWVTTVKSYAQDKAVKDGVKFQGFKLVEGRSNRKIVDQNALLDVLMDAGFESTDLIEPPKLLGVSKLERIVGKKKFAELSEGLVVKPVGAPTLVQEDDSRKEWNSAKADFE